VPDLKTGDTTLDEELDEIVEEATDKPCLVSGSKLV
jgi:hypothetical protein